MVVLHSQRATRGSTKFFGGVNGFQGGGWLDLTSILVAGLLELKGLFAKIKNHVRLTGRSLAPYALSERKIVFLDWALS